MEFMRNHQSSAIGIAGPRGSGKSTLMQAIHQSDFANHTVLIPAPVRYEAVDFTRRLFADVATVILSNAGYAIDRPRNIQKQRMQRSRWARATFLIGIVLSITSVITATAVKSVWRWYWSDIAAVVALTGLVVVCIATGLLAAAYLPSVVPRVNVAGNFSPSVYLAAEALDVLAWDTEEATTEKNTLKIFGGLLETGGEDSMTRSRRQMSQADIVDRFRKLLAGFSADSDNNRFVVFIDELDKIAETDGLINVINGLKDLLHIPGVHFVVSVSAEALRRFEERGVPARDAFDSAFDIIVPVKLLTLDESCQVLAARVAAFPTVLAMYCHAWSGGLPRELLRTARNCVEVQRSSSEIIHISTVIRKVIADDLYTHVQNALYDISDKKDGDINTLMRLRDLLIDLKGKANPLQILEAITSGSFPQGALTNTVTIGAALLACMPTNATDPDWWETPGHYMRTKIEAIAEARAALSAPVVLQAEIIARAVDLVSLSK
jgi:hypothetical protein